MKDGFLKVAAATPDVKVADVAYNVEQICRQIDEAQEKGAKIIVFPELSVTGYSCGDLFLQQTLLDAAEEGLIAIMRFTEGMKKKCADGTLIDGDALVFVGLPMEMDGKLYNVAAAIQHGKLLALIPKQAIPDYAEHDEGRYFAPGNAAPVPVEIAGDVVPFGTRIVIDATASVPGLMIGCEICEDAWIPEASHITLTSVGVTVMVNLSASSEAVGKEVYRRELVTGISARLITGYIYTSAGEGESTSDELYAAHRMIAENGVLLEESDDLTNGITCSELDIERLRVSRRRMTSYLSHPCADDSYHRAIISFREEETALTRHIPARVFIPEDKTERDIRIERILAIQSRGLKKRLTHTGCKKVVIGISGGLDSTLALLVCKRTFALCGLDDRDIIAVTMPCFGTSDRTYKNACALAKELQVTLKEIPTGDAVKEHLKDIGHDGVTQDAAFENAQARERTQVLMDLANLEGALVIGTGDLSELALGWCTYNGDQMSMYGVNSGVPKTMVREIVSYCAEEAQDEKLAAILKDIVDTPVSPELKAAGKDEITQKTEDIIGPYDLHDFFLYYMMRTGASPAKIFRLARYAFHADDSDARYDAAMIKRWLVVFYERFFAQQFKRAASPDGIRVGHVSLSPRKGLRMPSDAEGGLWIEEAKAIRI